MQQSKFALAFENSRMEDYVTEKFFAAVEAGAIPVVYGAPNIAQYAPEGGKSIIDASEYT